MPNRKHRTTLLEMANGLTRELFRIGQGDVAHRLVLTGLHGEDFGGWGFDPVRDQILAALRKAYELGGEHGH